MEDAEVWPLDRQKEAVENMLRAPDVDDEDDTLGADSLSFDRHRDSAADGAAAGSRVTWKILIYDDIGRDIIAPILRVTELRALGVTLHLSLNSRRQPIPDVPAVYFVAPTSENIARICEDCKNQLYDSMWLNFSSSLPRAELEALAEGTASSGSTSRIARVFDMYSAFVSLERPLFSLHMRDSFAALNNPRLTERDIEAQLERVVSGAMSVIITMRVLPIIRAPRGGPAEMVAAALAARLRELVVGRQSVLGNAPSLLERPLFVIFDRTLDLPVMLHHTWTYQALAHDLLTLALNRVSLKPTEQHAQTRTYDLDVKGDSFWAANAGRPFPQVAEAVEAALAAYRKDVEAVNAQAGAVGGDTLFDETQLAQGGASDALSRAVAQLPELRKRKQIIDMHTNIATALLDCIKDRALDGFFQLEDQLMSASARAAVETESVLSLLRDPARGTPLDKLRLALIFYLSAAAAGSEQGSIAQVREALTAGGCVDVRALDYAADLKAFSPSAAAAASLMVGTPQRAGVPGTRDQKNTAAAGLDGAGGSHLEKLMSTVVEHGVKGLTQVAQNFNKLIIEDDKALPVARLVDALMENRSPNDTSATGTAASSALATANDFVLFDPKAPKNSAPARASQRPFHQAIVLVVGGGNYVEYQNILDHTKPGRSVVYGSTELCNSEQFVAQLSSLTGREAPEAIAPAVDG
eukprot:CAMPEP_0185846406 /NCGR_PEP_ID=MMETSP1354-20130828/2054_1 /TAXON_ID=708628 /ORGANISM="Erythrolobus madagascarensis, Strain CCMP3276" /LENGTH=695 /DNA_ID=CAMNT_0028546535 /DNA_START=40 /DNA_END=2127 /DNA_ORIENTATION=+